jgi:hypothetical protein
MNQTNNIERNNLAVDPTDHQAGAMTSYSPESSSNNQSGQPGENHQPWTSN